MIPLKLELRNFLCYRELAQLDFSGMHVAVLVGDNGAGKSSLLDAITWAVWGKARAKRDDELVHQGQTEMRVAFTFQLHQETYRVTRQKKIGKGSGSLFDLQALIDGKWSSLSEATIPKTQARLERILRLNYDTFVNSAYLVQGQADEFTGKKPAERKQVLADILGLEAWAVYEERAKGAVRGLEQQLAVIDAGLVEIEAELARREDYERELTEATAHVLALTEQVRAAEAEWAALEAARQNLVGLQRQNDDVVRQVRDAERETQTLDGDLREARARADTAQLTADIDVVERALHDIATAEARRDTLNIERQAAAEQVAAIKAQNDAIQAEGESLKKRRAQIESDAALQARRLREAAQAEVSRLHGRVATLETATEPVCPLCGQALTADHRRSLLAELGAEAEGRLSDAEQAAAQVLQASDAACADLDNELGERRERFRVNQAQLKALGEQVGRYDRDLHDLAGQVRDKDSYSARQGELRAALAAAGAAQERIAALLERRERWSAARLAAEERARAIEAEIADLRERLKDLPDRQRQLDALRRDDAMTRARLGAAEQRLRTLETLEAQREGRRAERDAVAGRKGISEELREAFGKRGAPALIIETAVPEIEAEANRLLNRMTDGRMHVRFNMQRETLAGDVRETLDIQIADDLGTRAYELYSGGEAFRVNFAIRIALSQLLARRAGTQLHTLIIDEGFGVLDAIGRERLVQAINAVQDDFDRILVVTHIEELKDAFPARIEVTKTPEGSVIALG
jgi:exonuclease SbcC